MSDHDRTPDDLSSTDQFTAWIRRIVVGPSANETLPPADDVWPRIEARMHDDARIVAPRSILVPPFFGRKRTPPRGVSGLDSLERSPREPAGPTRWATRPLVVASLALCLAVAIGVGLRREWNVIPQRTYVNAGRQQFELWLTDGTRVVLGPQTSLVVARDFGRGNRTVSVTGEAYFDVVKLSGSPFVVNAGHVTSRVLGTTFDVKHYSDDADVRVAVVSGKVASGRNTDVVLTRGVVAHVTDSITTVITGTDMREYTAWITGDLVFTGAPVAEVLASVGRWYGIRFRLADSTLATQHVTTQLNYRTRDELLRALALLLDVQTTVDGDVVTLTPMHRRAAPAPQRLQQRTLTTPREVGR